MVIYPLNIICLISFRGLQVLPASIDPIPEVIREDFALVCLHDVSSYFLTFLISMQLEFFMKV